MFSVGKILLTLSLIISAGTLLAVDEYRYVVRGRAINTRGQPVPFAYVVVSPGPNNKGGDFIYSDKADAAGRIRFEVTDSNLVRTTRLIYVTGPLPLKAITLLKPPFDGFRWLNRHIYAGHRIHIKKNDELDIGNIPVKVFYIVVKVFLQDQFGKPLLKDATAWKSVSLRIRDEQGHFLTETSISREQAEQAVNLSESSVAIALPEGSWRVEISPDENTPWLTSDSPLIVRASSGQLQLILKPR